MIIGWLWPGLGADLRPLADGFIKLIKMLIAPIIFCTVVLGIAHVGDLKSVGRIGVKALIYFEAVTTFALLFGLLVGNLAKPGRAFTSTPGPWRPGPTPSRRRPTTGSCRTPSSSCSASSLIHRLGLRRKRLASGAVLRGAVRLGAGQVR